LGPPSLSHPSRAHAHTRIRRAQAARVVRSTHTDSVRFFVFVPRMYLWELFAMPAPCLRCVRNACPLSYLCFTSGWDGIEFAGWLGAVLIFSFRLIRLHAGCSTRQRPPRLEILPSASPHVPAPPCAGVHSLFCGVVVRGLHHPPLWFSCDSSTAGRVH
jgi:hypothetical protein